MQIEIGLLVTNEYGGSLIGTTHGDQQAVEFAAQSSRLQKIPPCNFITAAVLPEQSAEFVCFQVQNFSAVSVTITTGNISDVVQGHWSRKTIEPNAIAELKTIRGTEIFIVPFLPMPAGLQATKQYFEGVNWGADGIFLRWEPWQSVETYRLYKFVILQKGQGEWSVYQKWQTDVIGTELMDSDYKLEKFKGHNADTVYCVSALPFPDFPGERSWGVTFGSVARAKEGWIGASVQIPPAWP